MELIEPMLSGVVGYCGGIVTMYIGISIGEFLNHDISRIYIAAVFSHIIGVNAGLKTGAFVGRKLCKSFLKLHNFKQTQLFGFCAICALNLFMLE